MTKQLKPLVQAEFNLTIVKDLGMVLPSETSKKKTRYALFICPHCNSTFKASVNNVKTENVTMCSTTCDLYKPGKLTQIEIQKLFMYNPKTGIVTRKLKTARRQTIGEEVGVLTKNGYLKCGIGLKEYLIHRLVWLYEYGHWPVQVDHINSNTCDNRKSNLRDVTHFENQQNMSKSKRNTSGVVGVTYTPKGKKWLATIRENGTNHTKRFSTKFGAIRQRIKWNRQFNFHPLHGRKENS